MDDTTDAEAHEVTDPVALLLGREAPLPNRHDVARLEVHHVWGDTVLSSRLFARDEGVRIGTDTGDRWTFLGVDMGFVPRPLGLALRAVPLWTDLRRTWSCDFVVPSDDLPDGRAHELVTAEDGAQVLRVPAGAEATCRVGAETRDLPALVARGEAEPAEGGGWRVPLVPGLRFAVRVGEAVLVGGLVPAPRRVPVPIRTDDLPVVGLVSAAAGIAATVALTLSLLGVPAQQAAANELPEAYTAMLLDAPPPPVKPDPGARAAKGPEGRRGPRQPHPKPSPGDRPRSRHALDREVATHAGILGGASAEVDALLDRAGLSGDLVAGAEGLIGTSGAGYDGLGRRGDHLGGGGDAEALGSFEVGPGDGVVGPGVPERPKEEGRIAAGTGDPVVLGTLHASEIDEVVKRHVQEIRYCYQRELQRHPALGGKVVMKFTIASDGTVSSASPRAAMDGGEAVESCLVGRFERMQFPKPRGGGIVVVSYPLMFSAG